jgi:hypothetical protein
VTAEQPERCSVFDGFWHHIFEGILPQFFGVFGAVLTGFLVDLSGFEVFYRVLKPSIKLDLF